MTVRRFLFSVWQIMWGGVQSLVGFCIFLIYIKRKHYYFHGVIVTEWTKPSSTALGLFIFLSPNLRPDRSKNGKDVYMSTLRHEYGHAMQSMILGPFYLLAIGLPSAFWCNVPFCKKYRKKKNISYYSFYTERWADFWGEKVVDKNHEDSGKIADEKRAAKLAKKKREK